MKYHLLLKVCREACRVPCTLKYLVQQYVLVQQNSHTSSTKHALQ